MLDDAFQSSTDATLADLTQRHQAPKPQAPSISLWGLTRAPDKGVRAGVAESVASTADVLGAFGQVLATTPASAQGMFSTGTEDERRQSSQAAQQLREEGVDFRSEAGRSFRNVARDVMPDPVTAHGAEVAIAEFARLGSKAVAAGVTMGPVAGAAAAGLEEGFTAADKLAEEGVDLGTRTKVGAVTGLVTALGFGIPVAGKTVAGTVGLAVAGGPASFITQQAATREILSNAGYDKLADQYDPFDPVGLTLSTLVPLGFGAMAMRSRARRARAQDGAPVERTEVARAVDEVQVDAARVNLLRETIESRRLGPATDVRASEAHQTAVARAIDQMATGDKVEVGDLIPAEVREASPQIEGLARQIEQVRQEVLETEAPPPAVVAQLRQELTELQAQREVVDQVDVLARQLEVEQNLTPDQALTVARLEAAARAEELDLRIAEIEATVAKADRVTVADQPAAATEAAPTQRAPADSPTAAPAAASPAATAARQPATAVRPAAVEPAQPGRPAAASAADAPGAAGTQADAVPVESAAVARAAMDLEALNPDLMVQLDGMDKPVRLADLMAQVRQEVAQDLAEVPLIETAAACFLRS